MPQVKKHASDAQRQAAYRCRRRTQKQCPPLATANLAASPKVAALPATKRWRQGLTQAHGWLELVQQEMQDYFDERSEKWQEDERGDAFQERLDAITEAVDQLGDLLT